MSDAKSAVEGITDLSQLVKFMDRAKLPDQRATHHIFDIVAGDSLLYVDAHLRPRSDWALDLILEALQKKEKSQQEAFHDLIAPNSIASGFFGCLWKRHVHDFFQEHQGMQQTLMLRELGATSNEVQWTLTIQHSNYFPSMKLFSKLQTAVEDKKTSYLQPFSESYPTIDSMICTLTPFDNNVCSLVLLQIATNRHYLKVKGLQMLQHQICCSSLADCLRPSKKNPWAIIFVVPDDRAQNFTELQSLQGTAHDIDIWQAKTRQFVLPLSRIQVYG
jgi:hypothetical protein